MNEGKFENYCAFAVVVALAVGLWLWSCTFSGLYSHEGALFIRIIEIGRASCRERVYVLG